MEGTSTSHLISTVKPETTLVSANNISTLGSAFAQNSAMHFMKSAVPTLDAIQLQPASNIYQQQLYYDPLRPYQLSNEQFPVNFAQFPEK
uniref:Uncharacterized protein n=1 Tax=Panagrolaimus sp. JU765 TaxID=591449 RepID=A0AC34QIN2_9BILA